MISKTKILLILDTQYNRATEMRHKIFVMQLENFIKEHKDNYSAIVCCKYLPKVEDNPAVNIIYGSTMPDIIPDIAKYATDITEHSEPSALTCSLMGVFNRYVMPEIHLCGIGLSDTVPKTCFALMRHRFDDFKVIKDLCVDAVSDTQSDLSVYTHLSEINPGCLCTSMEV